MSFIPPLTPEQQEEIKKACQFLTEQVWSVYDTIGQQASQRYGVVMTRSVLTNVASAILARCLVNNLPINLLKPDTFEKTIDAINELCKNFYMNNGCGALIDIDM